MSETEPITAIYPPGDTEVIPAAAAVSWPAHDPARTVISCGGCGEEFAGDPGLPFTTPVLAAALAGAVTAAGWQQDGAAWTCTVCLAKANAPAPEPAPEPGPTAAVPEPGADPYDQSLAILAEFDARVPGFWAEVNRSNSRTSHKVYLREMDGVHLIRDLFGAAPSLLANPELGWALHCGDAGLTQQLAAMRRASAERWGNGVAA